MSEYFEKMFFWEEFLHTTREDNLNFIENANTEDRSSIAHRLYSTKRDAGIDTFSVQFDYQTDSFNCNDLSYNIKSETSVFLQRLDTKVPLMLNITSMSLRLLGSLLFNIKKMGFREVYCLYSEPIRYCKNIDDINKDDFDLYKEFKGIESIPGFLGANDKNLPEKWIIFMGFDGKRAEQINETYEFEDIIPVITLPSYKPGWQNYAFQENIDMLKSIDRKPEYIIANSFISAYDFLEKEKNTYSNNYLRITPLGTKINALGAMLFCLNHRQDVELLYDNPIAEGRISEDCGDTYVFDISEIINEKI